MADPILFVDLADFSNAVQVTPESPVCTDAAGVIYWQVCGVQKIVFPLKGLFMNSILGTRNAEVGSSSIPCLPVPTTDVIFSDGPYNALKVDVWSLGATVWETAQASPPFAEVQDPRLIGDRWPSLHQPEIYSRSFHEFLRLCSEPSASRPNPGELLNVCN
jgi:serine/threonine-protein kinase CLA4